MPTDPSLRCKGCGAAVRPEDLDDERGIFRCSFCGTVVRTRPPAAASDVGRPTFGMPSGITVEDDGHRLRIVERWFHPVHLWGVAFFVVWCGATTYFFRVVEPDAPWQFRSFPFLFAGAGAALGYMALAGLVNRTTVLVDPRDRISVRVGPVPWRGSAEVDVGDVAQLFTKEEVRPGRDGDADPLYTVYALTKAGRRLPLVRGFLTESEQALFLEQAIDRHLRIPDRPVGGEMPRS